MGRRLIEVMQLLVDQIHKAGYQHRALEDDIYAESQKRIAAEKDRDAARAEIETLRQQLAEAQRAASDEFERQVLTVEQQQDAAAWQQQVDSANAEISYLRARLDEERSVIASLRQQLAEAQQPDVGAMQAERERLANLVRFVEHVREFLSKNNSYITYADINGVRNALRSLDYQNPKVDVTEPVTDSSTTEPEGGT